MRIRRIVSALLSSAMLISACTLGVSALEENTTVIFGDINLDNAVSIIDSTELQKYLANMVSLDKLTEIDENLLDTNSDGAVNIEDATELQKHLADLQADEKIDKVAYIWHEPVYKTVHHPVETKVVHHDAVTHEEPIYEKVCVIICNQCGSEFSNMQQLEQHFLAGTNNDGTHSCWSYRKEARTVQTGTTTVVDKEAYDETVVVKEAWDEKVLVKEGYWEYK